MIACGVVVSLLVIGPQKSRAMNETRFVGEFMNGALRFAFPVISSTHVIVINCQSIIAGICDSKVTLIGCQLIFRQPFNERKIDRRFLFPQELPLNDRRVFNRTARVAGIT